MSERVAPEIAGCLGWLAFGTLALIGIFVYGWCQDFGVFVLIPLLSGIVSLLLVFFGQPWAKRVLLPSIGALFLGSLPHFLFLVAFNTSSDTTRLGQIANAYEIHAVAFHRELEPYADLAWYWWVPIFLVVALTGIALRYRAALSRLLWIKGGFEFFCLILAVACSVTFFSQTPGGRWTADVRARIRAEIPEVLKHQFPIMVREAVLATLKANHGWRNIATQDVHVLQVRIRHDLFPLWPRLLKKTSDLDDVRRYEVENDNFNQHANALYEESMAVGKEQGTTLALRLADAMRKILQHSSATEKTFPDTLDRLHQLQRERDDGDRRLDKLNEAISDLVFSVFKSILPEGEGLISGLAQSFAESLTNEIGSEIDEKSDGLTLQGLSLLPRRWSLQLKHRDFSRSLPRMDVVADWNTKLDDRVRSDIEDRKSKERIEREMQSFEREVKIEIRKLRPPIEERVP